MQPSPQRFDDAAVVIDRVSNDGKLRFNMVVRMYGTLHPGYTPQPCSDPDHPDFADPGCGPQFEIHDINEVEDIVISNTEHLRDEDLLLLEAIESHWANCMAHRRVAEAMQESWRLPNTTCARRSMLQGLEATAVRTADQHATLANWLEELLAARHGVGPWNQLQLSDEECEQLTASVEPTEP